MKILLTLFLALLLSISTLFSAELTYTLSWLTPNTHTLVVSLTTNASEGDYTDFIIPSWRPGRYIMQDYAGAVSHFEASDENGNVLKWHKTNKDSWRVLNHTAQKVRIEYRFFANNMDAGSSYYGPGQVYFNPVNVFMCVAGRYNASVQLNVPQLSNEWKIASALKRAKGNQTFTADSYHEFVDSPTVFADEMKQLEFDLDGTNFYIHFQGDYGGDQEVDRTIVTSLEKICKEQAVIFGGFPFKEYHFIYRLVPYSMRHAVEHSNSASFALPASVVSSPRSIRGGICGITSHEFWHVWNVKRIRPAALWPYDYSEQQYTGLHWFTEGVTDYYTNLILVRAGINDQATYLRQLGRTIQSLENNYAASVISPTASSFDSWLASSPYAHPDHRISYYSLGSRMGLLIDLEIRRRTEGKLSMDDLFRYLYANYYKKDMGVPENGIQTSLEALTESSWENFFNEYVHGTKPINYDELLAPFGLSLKVEQRKSLGKRGIGILQMEEINQGYLINKLLPGSDAFKAGIGVNDIILEIDSQKATEVNLDEYINGLKPGQTVKMSVLIGFKEVKKLEFEYKAAFAPKKYTLEKKKKTKTKEERMLSSWLDSKQ